MNKLFIGSNNLSKISDCKNYFEGDYEVVAPKDLGIELDVPEVGDSLEENATVKAREWAKASNMITLSDDSGFYITELGDKPGVITKRWLESNGFREDKLINFIKQLNNKGCYFRSVAAVASPDGRVYKYNYEVKGELISSNEVKSKNDIGYSLGRYFRQGEGTKIWSAMDREERKTADAMLIKQVKMLVSKLYSYSEIVKDIKNGPEKVKLGFPTCKPDQLAVEVFSFASSFQPNNCGLLTTKKDHKNPFKIHEVKAISLLGGYLGDANVDGYFSSGATESNLMAMWIAREKFKSQWIDEKDVVVIKTKLTHYSVSKAANILNLTRVEDVALDDDLSMNVSLLKEMIADFTKRGQAVIIINTSGYNVTGSSDKFDEANQIIEGFPAKTKEKVYLHVDAATSGFVSPFIDDRFKYLKYVQVRSVAVDGHKLGLIPYPCGLFMARKGLINSICKEVGYLGTQDQTFLGSRTGASASALWAMLNGPGIEFYKNNSQICITYKNYLIRRLKKSLPQTIIVNNQASNIVGVCFDDLPDNRLQKDIEVKYSLHPTKISLKTKDIPKYYYQVVITPEIDLATMDMFIKDLSESRL